MFCNPKENYTPYYVNLQIIRIYYKEVEIRKVQYI
jgi:hypothetical protein